MTHKRIVQSFSVICLLVAGCSTSGLKDDDATSSRVGQPESSEPAELAADTAEETPQDLASTERVDEEYAIPFPVGELLRYKVSWGPIPVAESVATTEWIEEEGKRYIAIRFRTKNLHIIQKLYPVDDFIESIVDPETLLPIRFTKRLNEGRYHCDEVTTFDHENLTAHFYSKTRDRHKEYAIESDTRDVVSFMYFMRSQRFEPGQTYTYRVMSDEKLYDLIVRPQKIDKVQVPGEGWVPSIRIEPEAAFEGIFVRKGKMLLWVSDDDRRFVTRVMAKVPVVADIAIRIKEISRIE